MPTADTSEIEALLDDLQRDSEARRAELRELAAALPQATSRRALVRQMVGGIVGSPDRTLVVKRVALKAARTPSDLIGRVRPPRGRG